MATERGRLEKRDPTRLNRRREKYGRSSRETFRILGGEILDSGVFRKPEVHFRMSFQIIGKGIGNDRSLGKNAHGRRHGRLNLGQE